jgi:AraC family transcriptional regulator of adaptative response/methylated-DNA-[protein]-cysteine methyltransferase
MSDYERVASAIEYIVANAATQPGLAEVAAQANLSPYHFQRLFSRWAGLTPKRFLQVMTVERAKRLLTETRLSLLETSESVGFSSPSRLHDHFVQLEAVTPGEFRRRGADLEIRYGHADSPFGPAFVAATRRGIAALAFVDEEPDAFDRMVSGAPLAAFVEDDDQARRLAGRVFGRDRDRRSPISVHVRGTNFQVAVWRALLAVPPGHLVSYGDVARAIGRPEAVRAVGTAVGANPCAFLIPCHRVIRESGEIGGYRWGLTRKRAINAWEAAASEVS